MSRLAGEMAYRRTQVSTCLARVAAVGTFQEPPHVRAPSHQCNRRCQAHGQQPLGSPGSPALHAAPPPYPSCLPPSSPSTLPRTHTHPPTHPPPKHPPPTHPLPPQASAATPTLQAQLKWARSARHGAVSSVKVDGWVCRGEGWPDLVTGQGMCRGAGSFGGLD